MKVIIKTAKKTLKKRSEMNLKELAKLVSEKVGPENSLSVKDVKNVIRSSDKFHVDGKIVTLKRRRSLSPSSSPVSVVEECDTPNKRSKSSNGKGEPSTKESPQDFASVGRWREENKIVIMHCNDEEKEKTKELNQMDALFPFTTFESPQCIKSISSALLKHCTGVQGFKKPSPIQAQAWPIMTQNGNNDMVGIAETGSGKTLAFALPALSAMSVKEPNQRRSPRMLVLAPTRELAMQSDQVLQEFGKVVGINSLVIYGGVPKHPQTSALKKSNVDCLVATPGRLKDLINEGSVDLSSINHLVLDEADRMLDMGFEEDVKFIISKCKSIEKGRQTVMFSATWPAAIQKIAMEYMVNPVRVYVGFESITGSNGINEVDDSLSANKRVKQTVEVIEDRQRDSRLRELLKKVHSGSRKKDRVLIFALYKKEAARLEIALQRDGWNCCSIHGDKNQVARTDALAQFKNGSCPLLVATGEYINKRKQTVSPHAFLNNSFSLIKKMLRLEVLIYLMLKL